MRLLCRKWLNMSGFLRSPRQHNSVPLSRDCASWTTLRQMRRRAVSGMHSSWRCPDTWRHANKITAPIEPAGLVVGRHNRSCQMIHTLCPSSVIMPNRWAANWAPVAERSERSRPSSNGAVFRCNVPEFVLFASMVQLGPCAQIRPLPLPQLRPSSGPSTWR